MGKKSTLRNFLHLCEVEDNKIDNIANQCDESVESFLRECNNWVQLGLNEDQIKRALLVIKAPAIEQIHCQEYQRWAILDGFKENRLDEFLKMCAIKQDTITELRLIFDNSFHDFYKSHELWHHMDITEKEIAKIVEILNMMEFD